jgi:hypothetical protein
MRHLLLATAVLALALPAAARADTAKDLRKEVTRAADRAAEQWAGLLTHTNVFRNPWPADVAIGHGSFVPPGLALGVHAAGLRERDDDLVRAAERAWPNAVAPERASAFDMLAAAYAYRTLDLTPARKAQLGGYLGRYGIPVNGAACITDPRCYNNLKLVDAATVLAITGAGIRAADPAGRLADPRAARAAAARIVDRRVPDVADFGLRAFEAGALRRGTVLSDPPADPTAYHALSAFMLDLAVRELGPGASRAARRARRATLEALALLVSPAGSASYLGRGQDQVWVPAITVAALAAGARAFPARAPRYLGAARAALRRLERLHATRDRGFDVVPGASRRTTTAGIDPYVHTVAYNGLALFALTAARAALRRVPGRTRVRKPPAARPLALRDPGATGLAIVADGRTWMAVHAIRRNTSDLRHDLGLLALERRAGRRWRDLLAPRPRTDVTTETAAPALLRDGIAIAPVGHDPRVRTGRVRFTADYRRERKLVRRVTLAYALSPRGARLTLTGAKRGDTFRLLAFTPAGTGRGRRRGLDAAGARWRFGRPVAVRRLPGYNSGAVEQLDAIEAVVTVPRSGRFRVVHGSAVR